MYGEFLQCSPISCKVWVGWNTVPFKSEKSKYHDSALIRLDQVLVNLAYHVGDDDLSGSGEEEIATITSYGKGTEPLFTPVARGAWNEIMKQLNAAEHNLLLVRFSFLCYRKYDG